MRGAALSSKTAQHSVHPIPGKLRRGHGGGSLRGLQAFFWLRVFPALRHFPSLPTNH